MIWAMLLGDNFTIYRRLSSKATEPTASCFFFDNRNNFTFFHRIFVKTPFNWRTPLGYAIAVSSEYVAAIITMRAISVVLVFLIGSCILLKLFIGHISSDLKLSNEIGTASNETDKKTKIKDYEFRIYEFRITAVFLWISLTLCCVFLIINLELVKY